MHCPEHHRLDDRATLFAWIEAHPLATWVCAGADGLAAHHLRFELNRDAGPFGTLRATIDADDTGAPTPEGSPALVIFHGPQIYITPGWYPGKAEHGRVVPTWNFAVVHAHGTVWRGATGLTIDIPIHRLEGKLKAGQDEARPDREGSVCGLHALGTEAARTMAALVRQALDNPPT